MSSTIFFFLFIPLLAFILLAINLIFAPHNPYMEKNSAFECGFSSFLGQNRTQFSISFFIFALLFLLFDLEILLVYPYLVSAYTNGIYGLTMLLLFLLALTLGFAFELGKKALFIDSRQTTDTSVRNVSCTSKIATDKTPLLGGKRRYSTSNSETKFEFFTIAKLIWGLYELYKTVLGFSMSMHTLYSYLWEKIVNYVYAAITQIPLCAVLLEIYYSRGLFHMLDGLACCVYCVFSDFVRNKFNVLQVLGLLLFCLYGVIYVNRPLFSFVLAFAIAVLSLLSLVTLCKCSSLKKNYPILYWLCVFFLLVLFLVSLHHMSVLHLELFGHLFVKEPDSGTSQGKDDSSDKGSDGSGGSGGGGPPDHPLGAPDEPSDKKKGKQKEQRAHKREVSDISVVNQECIDNSNRILTNPTIKPSEKLLAVNKIIDKNHDEVSDISSESSKTKYELGQLSEFVARMDKINKSDMSASDKKHETKMLHQERTAGASMDIIAEKLKVQDVDSGGHSRIWKSVDQKFDERDTPRLRSSTGVSGQVELENFVSMTEAQTQTDLPQSTTQRAQSTTTQGAQSTTTQRAERESAERESTTQRAGRESAERESTTQSAERESTTQRADSESTTQDIESTHHSHNAPQTTETLFSTQPNPTIFPDADTTPRMPESTVPESSNPRPRGRSILQMAKDAFTKNKKKNKKKIKYITHFLTLNDNNEFITYTFFNRNIRFCFK